MCLQSAETVRDWTAALNTAIRQGSYRPRKLLVFLNPYGGAKRARQVWQTVVAPIFDLAGVRLASPAHRAEKQSHKTLQVTCIP